MNIVIAAGGTAGHINPGISIAKTILEKNPSAKIYFIGTEYGLEKALVPKAGFEIRFIHSKGLSKNPIKLIRSGVQNLRGIFEAKKILTELKPKIVIGMGGYVCAPVLFVAKKMLNIPVFIHESNAIPGKTNKFIAGFADGIAVGFSKTKEDFSGKAVFVTGNPINKDFYSIVKQFSDIKTILFFGGSQGSKAINDVVIELLARNKSLPYKIVYATGEKQYDKVIKELEKKKVNINDNVQILPYIYNMPELLSKVSVAVTRAGALTVSELKASNTPAILIPLPTAAENHQEYNAKTFAEEGRGTLILEKDLTVERLKSEIEKMLEMSKDNFYKKSDICFASEEFYRIIEKYL